MIILLQVQKNKLNLILELDWKMNLNAMILKASFFASLYRAALQFDHKRQTISNWLYALANYNHVVQCWRKCLLVLKMEIKVCDKNANDTPTY